MKINELKLQFNFLTAMEMLGACCPRTVSFCSVTSLVARRTLTFVLEKHDIVPIGISLYLQKDLEYYTKRIIRNW
jgi:hypothetical protein